MTQEHHNHGFVREGSPWWTTTLEASTQRLLDDPRTFLQREAIPKKQHPSLKWETLETDRLFFDQALGIFLDTATLSDEEFRESILPQIIELSDEMPLYKRLHDPHIRVTPNHKGETPAEHSIKVLELIQTDIFPDDQRGWMRLLAWVHDIGKSLSAGLDRDHILALYKYDHTQHSYPDHCSIGVLLLQQLAASETSTTFQHPEYQQVWQSILFIIRNHHILQKLGFYRARKMTTELEQGYATLQAVLEQYPMLAIQWFAALCHADMNSNKSYRSTWPRTVRLFMQMIATQRDHISSVHLEQLQILAPLRYMK